MLKNKCRDQTGNIIKEFSANVIHNNVNVHRVTIPHHMHHSQSHHTARHVVKTAWKIGVLHCAHEALYAATAAELELA